MSHGRSNDTDQFNFSETESTTMEEETMIHDDLILDMSDSDIVDPDVGGYHGDSTHAPSAPSVPMPEATTSVIA